MLPDVELLIRQCECHSYYRDVHDYAMVCPAHCLLIGCDASRLDTTFCSFLARGSMLSALGLYAIARPVRPSVRPSVTRVDQSKTVELRVMQFSPYSSPMRLVLRHKFHP